LLLEHQLCTQLDQLVKLQLLDGVVTASSTKVDQTSQFKNLTVDTLALLVLWFAEQSLIRSKSWHLQKYPTQ
jgi:hypothetical protein